MKQPNEVDDYPPNVQIVYRELRKNAPLRQRDLIENTNLPFRVVRDALTELKRTDAVDELVYSHGHLRLYLFTEHVSETAERQPSAV
ncbi:MAG: hypothetical protein U5K70_09650 [Halodesulfurarchaeum sp.]|nr:hypothetical protein [Halodesulfurarchaeum sp.]